MRSWPLGRYQAAIETVDVEHLRVFLLSEERRTSAVSAAVHYRNLRVFFGWLAREEERSASNPMQRVDKPKVVKKAKPFFTDDELARLLKTRSGQTFEDRRDTAVIRVLIDTGMRVSGLANLRYDPADGTRNDVFLTLRRLRIQLKGRDETWVRAGRPRKQRGTGRRTSAHEPTGARPSGPGKLHVRRRGRRRSREFAGI